MQIAALALGLASLMSAQGAVADLNEPVIQDALTKFAFNQSLFLQLNGSITYRGKVTPLVTNLYWNTIRSGSRQTLQVDMESYSNGVLIKRIVGDGDSLFSYDLLLHQYSATLYGSNNPTQVRRDTYQVDLLNALNLEANGNDGYLTKLLRQIFTIVPTAGGGLASNFTSWMPGVPTFHLLQGNPVPDTISPNVTYYPSAGLDYYAYNTTPKRTIVFEIASDTTVDETGRSVNGLVNVYFNQMETINRFGRLIQWVITPYSGFAFSTSQFVPYSGQDLRGWRVVVAARPVTH